MSEEKPKVYTDKEERENRREQYEDEVREGERSNCEEEDDDA